jgi:hypothetical protein
MPNNAKTETIHYKKLSNRKELTYASFGIAFGGHGLIVAGCWDERCKEKGVRSYDFSRREKNDTEPIYCNSSHVTFMSLWKYPVK